MDPLRSGERCIRSAVVAAAVVEKGAVAQEAVKTELGMERPEEREEAFLVVVAAAGDILVGKEAMVLLARWRVGKEATEIPMAAAVGV